jgi:predicted dinucleotide-binding enzyme
MDLSFHCLYPCPIRPYPDYCSVSFGVKPAEAGDLMESVATSERRKEAGMRIATIGRGKIGGGLGDRWERAGHEVTRIGREGGDVSAAEVVLLAVPGGAVAEALEGITGLEGKTTIDATNLVGTSPPQGFASNAEFVRAHTGGPTAKSFNINFAALFDRLDAATSTPSNIWCGDEAARAAVEELNRDAGYAPVYAGPLENASMQESFLQLMFAIAKEGGMGPFVYRMAAPEEL